MNKINETKRGVTLPPSTSRKISKLKDTEQKTTSKKYTPEESQRVKTARGMTLEQFKSLTSQDINKMSEAELSAALLNPSTVARKRFANLEKAVNKGELDERSPAYKKYEGETWRTKGLTHAEKIEYAHELIDFLNLKTSNVKAAKDYQKNVLQHLEGLTGYSADDDRKEAKDARKEFWNVYDKYKELYGGDIYSQGSPKVMQSIWKTVAGNVEDSAENFQRIHRALNRLKVEQDEQQKKIEEIMGLKPLKK